MAKPLTDLTQKEKEWTWTEVEQQAFEELKTLVKRNIVLKVPKGDGPFVLVTDASNIGQE